MITLTKEWLLKTIAELEEERDAVPGVVNEDAAKALAAMKLALASLEAEPVKRVNADQMHRVCLEANRHLDKYGAMAKEVNKLLGRAAPPAPVSVPDELSREEYKRRFMDEDNFDDTFRGGWIACRAAMLQDAEHVSNRDELTDGWVACSERMPDADGNYWGWWSESKRQGPVWFIKSVLQAQFQSSEITHWMPLPAAPQQDKEHD